MKKIILDFFEIMKIKSDESLALEKSVYEEYIVVEEVSRNPIILELMTLFFRSLLINYNSVPNIEKYDKHVSTEEAYYIICEIFDIQCRMVGEFFQFMEEGLFISSHDKKEYVFGNFYVNESELRKAETHMTKSTLDYLKEKNMK